MFLSFRIRQFKETHIKCYDKMVWLVTIEWLFDKVITYHYYLWLSDRDKYENTYNSVIN